MKKSFKKFFEAQDPGEEVVMVIRKHPIYLFGPLALGLALLILVPSLYLAMRGIEIWSGQELVLRTLIGSTVLFIELFIYIVWLMKYMDIFLITTERIVHIEQHALFARKVSVLGYGSVQDASVTQRGVLPTIFNYGTVLVQTAAETIHFEVESIGGPELVQDKIMELRDSFIKSHKKVPTNS
jgi:hypothetical protein